MHCESRGGYFGMGLACAVAHGLAPYLGRGPLDFGGVPRIPRPRWAPPWIAPSPSFGCSPGSDRDLSIGGAIDMQMRGWVCHHGVGVRLGCAAGWGCGMMCVISNAGAVACGCGRREASQKPDSGSLIIF